MLKFVKGKTESMPRFQRFPLAGRCGRQLWHPEELGRLQGSRREVTWLKWDQQVAFMLTSGYESIHSILWQCISFVLFCIASGISNVIVLQCIWMTHSFASRLVPLKGLDDDLSHFFSPLRVFNINPFSQFTWRSFVLILPFCFFDHQITMNKPPRRMSRPNKSAAKDNRKVEPMATLQIAEGRWLAWKLVNDPGWLANTAFCLSFFVWACGLRETCGQVDQVLFTSQRFAGVCFVAGGVLCRQGWQLTPGFYVTGQASHGKPASRDKVKIQMCQKGW